MGTCKQIEAVLNGIRADASLSEQAQAGEYFDANGVLKPESVERFDVFLQAARSVWGDFRCYDDALALVLQQREIIHRQRWLINLNLQRMSRDSTYLIDQDAEQRHDTKLTELRGILDEYLTGTSDKAVVFSQWERMTRLAATELEPQGIGYAYLHGGMPSAKRKDLQNAALLINLDIPWNPAVLEQRIARIHRMGQKSKVQIINLVSRRAIEQRMLDTLAFKRDLAEGVLDNGNDSIFLDNERYKGFMNCWQKPCPNSQGNSKAFSTQPKLIRSCSRRTDWPRRS